MHYAGIDLNLNNIINHQLGSTHSRLPTLSDDER